MYLSESERQELMALYGCEQAIHINHYEVGPDTWIYLFKDDNIKYLLISVDHLGDYDFEVFPRLLRFNDDAFPKLEFVLQREIPVKNQSLKHEAVGTILFEYTD